MFHSMLTPDRGGHNEAVEIARPNQRVLDRVEREGDLFGPVLRRRQLLLPALARLSGP
jgi:hypothetical protein